MPRGGLSPYSFMLSRARRPARRARAPGGGVPRGSPVPRGHARAFECGRSIGPCPLVLPLPHALLSPTVSAGWARGLLSVRARARASASCMLCYCVYACPHVGPLHCTHTIVAHMTHMALRRRGPPAPPPPTVLRLRLESVTCMHDVHVSFDAEPSALCPPCPCAVCCHMSVYCTGYCDLCSVLPLRSASSAFWRHLSLLVFFFFFT